VPPQPITVPQSPPQAIPSPAASAAPASSDDIIANIPCPVLFNTIKADSSSGRPEWYAPNANRPPSIPFGVPYLQWDEFAFSRLMRRERECEPSFPGSPSDKRELRSYLAAMSQLFIPDVEQSRRKLAASDEAKARIDAQLQAIAALKTGDEKLQKLRAIVFYGLVPPTFEEMRRRVQVAMDAAEDEKEVEQRTQQSSARLAAAQAELARQQQAIQDAQNEAKRQADLAAQADQERRAAEQRRAQAAGQIAGQDAEAARLQQQADALSTARAQQEALAADAASRAAAARRSADAANASAGAAEADQKQRNKLEIIQKNLSEVVSRNESRISNSGLDDSFLDSPLILPFPPELTNGGPITMRTWISIVVDMNKSMNVHGITAFNGSRTGVALKSPGSPTTNLLFRQDGGELYLAGGGTGDTVQAWGDDQAKQEGWGLMLLLAQWVQKLITPSQ
jgi:hypothetical protein